MPLLPPVRVFSDYRTSFGTGCAEAVRMPKRGVREMRKRIVPYHFVCLFVSLLDSQVAFDTISCIAKDKYMNRSILNSILIKFFLFFMPLIKLSYLNLHQEKRQLN